MKRSIVFIVCCLCANLLYSQDINTYRGIVNKAELQITDNRFDSALIYYRKAFAKTKFVLSKEYYNATLCAIKTGNKEEAKRYVAQLCYKGFLTITDTSTKYNLLHLVGNDLYNEFKKYTDTIKTTDYTNPQLKNVLDTMIQDDQRFRKRSGRGVDYMKGPYAKIISLIDSINAYHLLAIIKKDGIPDEFQIGIQNDGRGNINYNNSWYIVLIHQGYGSLTRIIDFSEYILNAIKNEKLPPHTMLNAYERINGGINDSIFGSPRILRVKNKEGKFKYFYIKEDSLSVIRHDEIRKQYNLEKAAESRKKLIYWIKTKQEFAFDFLFGYDIDDIPEDVIPMFNQKLLIYFDIE